MWAGEPVSKSAFEVALFLPFRGVISHVLVAWHRCEPAWRRFLFAGPPVRHPVGLGSDESCEMSELPSRGVVPRPALYMGRDPLGLRLRG